MLRWGYSLLLYLLLPFILLYFAWRGLRERGYLRGWGQRLGFGRKLPPGGFWVHAASVGEAQAALALINALRHRYPDVPFLVTTVTPTGVQRARASIPDDIAIQYAPLDLPHALWFFQRRVRPRIAIIIETEIWPNLLRSCWRNQVPVLLASACVSSASLKRYRSWPLRALMQPALRAITQIAAASEEDAKAFCELGVPPERVAVAGNLKFDLHLPEALHSDGQALRQQWQADERPVWVAASTHAGEETMVLNALRKLHARHPDTLLVLVPRHPQRFTSVAILCREQGFAVARRSREETVGPRTQIVLGDSLGELRRFYAAADVALVGGSLVSGIGGHNLLEPAALRLPIIVGRHAHEWTQVSTWLEADGALCKVANADALAQAVAECFEDAAGRKRAGIAAARVVEEHGGALERTLRLVPNLLASRGRV